MTFQQIVDSVLQWMIDCRKEQDSTGKRPWCTFGLKKSLSRSNIHEYFSREDLNGKFNENYRNTDPSKAKPFSFNQSEIHLIHSTEKAFTVRHRTRMQVYADDAEMKMLHISDGIIAANAKLETFKNRPTIEK